MGNIQPSLGKLTLVYPGASWGSFTTESSGSKGNGWCFLNPPPHKKGWKFEVSSKLSKGSGWCFLISLSQRREGVWTLNTFCCKFVNSPELHHFWIPGNIAAMRWGSCTLSTRARGTHSCVRRRERERVRYCTLLLAAHDDNTPGSSRVKGTMHCNSPIITHLIILYGGTSFFLMLSHKNLLLHTGVSYACATAVGFL
jgi:hypothetical protein